MCTDTFNSNWRTLFKLVSSIIATWLVADCQLAIIMDLAQTNTSNSRQAKLDVLKP